MLVHLSNSDIGEKLAHKLRELEEEKMQLERERASQESGDNRRHQESSVETLRMNEENLRKQEELTRQEDESRQQQLEQQRAETIIQEEEDEVILRDCEIRRQEDILVRATENGVQEVMCFFHNVLL